MPEAYEIFESRFIQGGSAISAANALTINSATVPKGKVWTILAASYNPSVSELRTVHWRFATPMALYSVSIPVTITLSDVILYPLVTQGMEIKIYQGQALQMVRDVATAGSTMTILYEFIENDIPFYSWEDPMNKIVRQKIQHLAPTPSSKGTGAALGLATHGGTREGGGRAGGGGREPI